MSPTKVRPTGDAGARCAALSLADCTPLFSLAAGAAGSCVRRESGAASGGDPRAVGGPCTPAAGIVPRRPNRYPGLGSCGGELELRPRLSSARLPSGSASASAHDFDPPSPHLSLREEPMQCHLLTGKR